MLADKEMFDSLEDYLIRSGKLGKFESENGKIKGRMMITLAEVPDGMDVKYVDGKTPLAFEASFDFYDVKLGIAMYPDTKQPATGIWIIPQKENAKQPSREWIEFFIEKLAESIEDDGSYGVPMYSFINDSCDMTVIPTKEYDI